MIELNKEQQEAVDDWTHTLLLLAAAGSGKTRVITQKIIKAIEEEIYSPNEILAITFTTKAAGEMRSRLSAGLSERDSSRLMVKTFHSFSVYILRKFSENIGIPTTFEILDNNAAVSLISQLNADYTYKDAENCYKNIQGCKSRDILPDDTERLERYIPEPSFRKAYLEYESALRANDYVDFGDLMILANRLLEEFPSVRHFIQNRFRLVLVDEYQDANASQFKMLKAITTPATQVVAVGDDDQSIYGFRGSNVRNILNFEKDYRNVRVIKLERNYRSTKRIVALARDLIKQNTNRHDKTMTTENEEGDLPTVTQYPSEIDEARYIADEIKKNGDYGNTAVLYRINALSADIESELLKRDIPYVVIGSFDFWKREEIKDCIAFCRLLSNPADREAFSRIVNKPAKGIGDVTIKKISDRYFDLVSGLREFGNEKSTRKDTKEGIDEFIKAYDNMKFLIDIGTSPGDLIEKIAAAFRLEDYYKTYCKKEELENTMMNISNLVKVANYHEGGMRGLETLFQLVDNTVVRKLQDEDKKDKVRLMSIHASKGLEFGTVYLIGTEEEMTPGEKAVTSEDVEEERRIFYVAVTRAMRHLHISYPKCRYLWGKVRYRHQSEFLSDFPEEDAEFRIADEYVSSASLIEQYRGMLSVPEDNMGPDF